MNLEEVHIFCSSLPHVEATTPFGPDVVAYKVGGLMFACISLDRPEWVTVKCDPVMAIELREQHRGIEPAWHFNKKHWNQINLTGSIHKEMIEQQILNSYDLVVAKLPRATRILLEL